LQFVAEASGAAAVVRDGDDGGETLDPNLVVGFADELLQTAE